MSQHLVAWHLGPDEPGTTQADVNVGWRFKYWVGAFKANEFRHESGQLGRALHAGWLAARQSDAPGVDLYDYVKALSWGRSGTMLDAPRCHGLRSYLYDRLALVHLTGTLDLMGGGAGVAAPLCCHGGARRAR